MISLPRKKRATTAKRSTVKRPDATPDVLRAIARWKVGLPGTGPNEVDRAVIAALLSFGGELAHDPALSGALLLLERTRQLLAKLAWKCDFACDTQTVRRAIDALEGVTKDLRTIEPQGFDGEGTQVEEAQVTAAAVPSTGRRNSYIPTEEEIAAACAEIRAARMG